MTPEEHQAEHIRLHRALDELLACYMTENSRGLTRKVSIHDQILDLLQWGYEKTMKPSPLPEHSHDSRGPDDFEAQRQMILLALAELALSRPGWDESIREIAWHYDGEDLEMFKGFKRTSADRVKQTHGDL